jgi:autotransporter-associated beta strand protein
LTLTGTNAGNNTLAAVIGDNSGATSLTKNGIGTWVLSAADTYTGATTINAGTLSLDNNNATTARLASTSGITVNSGGTLLVVQSGATASTDRINNSATMTLNGGTFKTGGLSEGSTGSAGVGLGALTLQANSFIDLGSGSTSILHFADSHLVTWTAGLTLEIDNWSGSVTGGGTEQLLVGIDSTGLTAAQIAEVIFRNPGGLAAGDYTAMILSTGELVPVPEPATWLAAGLTLCALALTRLRKRSPAAAGRLSGQRRLRQMVKG